MSRANPASLIPDEGGAWEDMVPGVESQADSDGFPGLQATLHAPGVPYKVAWRCEHNHPGTLEAEACGVAEKARRTTRNPPPQGQLRAIARPVRTPGLDYRAETSETWTISQADLLEYLGIVVPDDARVDMAVYSSSLPEDGTGEPKLLVVVKYQPRVA